jgi:hypothetical protein
MARQKKIAIIGARGYNSHSAEVRVVSYAWDRLDEVANLKDFDTVVLDLLSEVDRANYEKLARILDARTMLDVLGHQGVIILLGDPRAETTAGPFLSWTAMNFNWDSKPGDTIEKSRDWKEGPLREYSRHFSRWEYALRSVGPDEHLLAWLFPLAVTQSNRRVVVEKEPFAWNRYSEDLAFAANLAFQKQIYHSYGEKWETESRFGSIIFLPKVDLPDDEALLIVLRDVCGVEAGIPEPEWIASYSPPGQTAIDDQIEKIKEQISAKRAELDGELVKREAARDCLKLLYERGQPLEVIVRSTLRELGAAIEEPTDPGKEDGWIGVAALPGEHEGVLEVKSTKNEQFDEYGLRQLLEWISRGVELRHKKYKGIFVGSNSVDEPAGTRKSGFSDNWKKSAELHGIVALRSEDLYELYLLRKEDQLDLGALWEAVFSTNGVLDISGFRPSKERAS